jgi:hypothetical protein
MTNELEKQKERLYKHFGFTGENIESQKQVRTDIYNILTDMGYKAQTPNCVAIDTENGWHKIIGYPFNKSIKFFIIFYMFFYSLIIIYSHIFSNNKSYN